MNLLSFRELLKLFCCCLSPRLRCSPAGWDVLMLKEAVTQHWSGVSWYSLGWLILLKTLRQKLLQRFGVVVDIEVTLISKLL